MPPLIFKLPKFRRKDDAELWLFRYNKIAELNKWSSDIRLNYVDNSFDNKMQVWFMQQNFKDWKQFQAVFTYKYAKKVKLDKIFVEIINFKMNKSENIDAYIERFDNKRMQYNREVIKRKLKTKDETLSIRKNKDKASADSEDNQPETSAAVDKQKDVAQQVDDAGLSISENGFIKFFTKGLNSKGLKRFLKSEKPETLDEAYELLREMCDSEEEMSDDDELSYSDSSESSSSESDSDAKVPNNKRTKKSPDPKEKEKEIIVAKTKDEGSVSELINEYKQPSHCFSK